MPPCPRIELSICLPDVYSGAHLPKTVPLVCPLGAPQKNSTTILRILADFLCVRVSFFAYTRKVFCVYAKGNNSVLNALQLGSFFLL